MTDETATEVTAAPTDATTATAAPSEGQTTAAPSDEEVFFDPKAIPPELMPAYKQMQKAFTQKTQTIAQARQKIEAYDQFMRDPRTNLLNMARQYGIQIDQPPSQPQSLEDWQPKTWQEVIERSKQIAKEELMQELAPQLQPVYHELSNLKRTHTEKLLDENVPDWRQYEDQMADLLDKHPTLANDPVTLANLAIPSEIRESRAMQAAMKKLENKVKASEVSGGSSTKASTTVTPSGKPTFAQAIELARTRLKSG